MRSGLDGRRHVFATERDRVEIRLAPGPGARVSTQGYLLVDGQLRELPKGSSFDPDRGNFYWQPGLGFMGDYDFVFVRTGADGARERIPVRVTLQPAATSRLASTLSGPWARVSFTH